MIDSRLEPVGSDVLVRSRGRRIRTWASRMRFSAHRCFGYDASPSDLRCLGLLRDHLLGTGASLALCGTGPFLAYLLEHAPELRPRVRCVVDDGFHAIGEEAFGFPVVAPDALPADVELAFLCETRTVPRDSMRRRLRPGLRVLCPDVLADLDRKALPARAWMPVQKSIYPLQVPDVEFQSGQDLIIVDCPSRNLAMLPNGLAYVYNALKDLDLRFQILDLDLIVYHRYHTYRLFDAPDRVLTAGGHEMLEDPWVVSAYEEWQNPEVLDFFRPDLEEVVRKLVAARPRILGLSIQACNLRFAREVVRGVKAALPETLILVGGFSCYQASVGRRVFPEADYMCIGEADLTVGPLVEALLRGERPRDLPGVSSVHDTPERSCTEGPKPNDLDKLEMIRYEFTDLSLYKNYDGFNMAPVLASRGCRWSRCTFCAERFFWRVRSPQAVVDEFEFLADKGFDLFVFNESDLNGKPEVLLGVCDEIIRRRLNVRLTGQLRIHKNSDRAFFDKLRQAGFESLRFGVDAWARNTLKLQMKGYRRDMILQNLRDCQAAGIDVDVNTVIGVPGETEGDIDETIESMVECKPYITTFANINSLMLVIGSVYWEEPEKHGIVFHGDMAEILERYHTLVPDHLWHSENPYIDGEIRTERFKRIVRALHAEGCNLGSFAAKVIEDVFSGKGCELSARPDTVAEIRGAGCETPGSVPLPAAAPAAAAYDEAYALVECDGAVYGIPPSAGLLPDEPRAILVRNGAVGRARRVLRVGAELLHDPQRLRAVSKRALWILRTQGVDALVQKVRQKLRFMGAREAVAQRAVATMTGTERVPS